MESGSIGQSLAISVIVPAYNSEKTIENTLKSLQKQTMSPDEVIIVDDASTDRTPDIAEKYFRLIRLTQNQGPAKARNIGIRNAAGDIVAFIDADCEATPTWIESIKKCFTKNPEEMVIMGNIQIPASTVLGDSISALGFPGGGAVGFDKMWKVDEHGYTDHITSANFAARKKVFETYGFFDESFPLPGSEDPELSFRLSRLGVRIHYCSEVLVYHVPRTSFASFVRWQVVRGRGNYYFKQKVGPVGNFIKLRLWSSMNIVKKYIFDIKFPIIIGLLGVSFFLQQYGFYAEARKNRYAPRS